MLISKSRDMGIRRPRWRQWRLRWRLRWRRRRRKEGALRTKGEGAMYVNVDPLSTTNELKSKQTTARFKMAPH